MTDNTNIFYYMIGHISHSFKILFSSSGQGADKLSTGKLSYCYNDKGKVYQNSKFHEPQEKGSCARVRPFLSY